jgi:hypothetical protein
LRIDSHLRKMRRWGAWSRFFGNDVGGAQKRVARRSRCGHMKGLLLIRMVLYRLPTSCGAVVDASQGRTNARQVSYRYHVISFRANRITRQGATGPDAPAVIIALVDSPHNNVAVDG